MAFWNMGTVHGERFVVPDVITMEQLEAWKRGVRTLAKGIKYEDFYPPFVVSYASGRRPGDCEGSGPGVVYVKGLMEFLHGRGVQCFSGLQVPAGVDWETFMLRLTGMNGKREKPKVLIVILTAALYRSKPCLKEISTAIKNKITLLPVRFEDKLPAKEDQWTDLEDEEWEMMKFRVQEKLNSLNNIPNPGTVLNVATALEDIMAEIERHLPTTDAPTPPQAAPASPAKLAPRPPTPKPSGGRSEDGPHPSYPSVMEREGITAPRDTLETRLSTLEAAERVKIAAEKALKEAEERMVRLSNVSASPSGPMPEPAPAKLAPRPPPPKPPGGRSEDGPSLTPAHRMLSIPPTDEDLKKMAAEAADRRLKGLTDEAERGARDIHVADHMPIKRFFYAAKTILQQARTLAGEQDLERAYVLLIRFSFLVVEVLPTHAGFKTAEVADDRKALINEVSKVLEEVALVKNMLRSRYLVDDEARIRAEVAVQQQAPTPPQEPRRARTKAEMLERQSSCCGLCTESEEAFLWRKLAAMEDWELKASVDNIYRPERHTCFGLYIESKKKFEARNDLWKRLPAACHRWIVPC